MFSIHRLGEGTVIRGFLFQYTRVYTHIPSPPEGGGKVGVQENSSKVKGKRLRINKKINGVFYASLR